MEAWNYTGPKETSETFNKYQKSKNIRSIIIFTIKIKKDLCF